ncbi:MAG: RNA-binding domain-containing protein [Candidatus Muiribacteriota bacterium]
MTDIHKIAAKGEDSKNQFKADIKNADSLAAEMAAFANSEGGTIYIGISDDGSIPGLDRKDTARINQLISNSASQHIRSPLTVSSENILLDNGKIVISVKVPKGIDKPYFDKNGVIWLKTGSDKRKVNSKEELRRLFQSVDLLHADEIPTRAGIDKLDRISFRNFLKKTYKIELPEDEEELLNLLKNMNLATDEQVLNLAGVLLFSENPQWIKPEFIVKAVTYPGNNISVSEYLDSEDFYGSLKKLFDDSIAFIMRNLKKIQAGRSINTQGIPEIPEIVFEEILVNALIHRDYFISAGIRIFIFDDRIEIISPGHLPNHLTVEKIKTGNSNIRNPILASFTAKNLLPYRGLGSGIRRALEEWPYIDFIDDRKGCIFKAVIYRGKKEIEPLKKTDFKSSDILKVQKKPDGSLSEPINSLQVQIFECIKRDPYISYEDLANELDKGRSTIMRHIQKLKDKGTLIRIGSKKTGYWEVIEKD